MLAIVAHHFSKGSVIFKKQRPFFLSVEKSNVANDIKFLKSFIQKHLVNYPTPNNLNYLWGFGSIIGLFFVGQIISGILLAMHYTPHISLAFSSIEHIMRDVPSGWFWRYFHANGASFVFIFLYLHLFKGLYYRSYIYPYMLLWKSGMLIFILMMATAFMGYVLPYGQMSFWGATVIINLFSAIPKYGILLVNWLLGGYAVDNPTLNRFFSLHYLLPFLIAGLTILHLTLLHLRGSTNPLGINDTDEKIPFFPYFYLKDFVGFLGILLFFVFIIFFIPNYLGHSDNYIEANALVTPTHIVPEWYFLPFYAMLRSIPNKLGGVLCMGLSLILLLLLPVILILQLKIIFSIHAYQNNFFNKNYDLKNYQLFKQTPFFKLLLFKSPKFSFISQIFFWLFFFNLLFLGYIGGHPVEQPYIFLGQIATFFYFSYLCLFVPITFYFEINFFLFLERNTIPLLLTR